MNASQEQLHFISLWLLRFTFILLELNKIYTDVWKLLKSAGSVHYNPILFCSNTTFILRV